MVYGGPVIIVYLYGPRKVFSLRASINDLIIYNLKLICYQKAGESSWNIQSPSLREIKCIIICPLLLRFAEVLSHEYLQGLKPR